MQYRQRAWAEISLDALAHNVNVHIVSNALSLAEYFYEIKQVGQADRMIRTAEEYISAVSDPLLLEKLDRLKQRIERTEIFCAIFASDSKFNRSVLKLMLVFAF